MHQHQIRVAVRCRRQRLAGALRDHMHLDAGRLVKQRQNVRQKPTVLQRGGRGKHYRLRLGGLARCRERSEQTHNAD
jgi:hypothetical protein